MLLDSLHSELVGSHWDAVDKLHGTPQAVELHALVHMHDAVAGQRPAPDGVLQEATHPRQDDLEHGEAAAEPLLGQQVTLTRDCNLLKKKQDGGGADQHQHQHQHQVLCSAGRPAKNRQHLDVPVGCLGAR